MVDPIASKTGSTHRASPEELDELMQVISLRGWIALIGFAILITAAFVWSLVGTVTDTVDAPGILARDVEWIVAPCDGVVTKFVGLAGDRLEAHAPLFVVTPARGQPQTVNSDFPCRILSHHSRKGDQVKKDARVLVLENLTTPLVPRLYIPVNAGYNVGRGMPVHVSPATVSPSEFGYLDGKVVSAARFPITQDELTERVLNEDLARGLAAGGPKLQILVELDADPTTASGYRWSSSNGPPLTLYSGTPCQGRIIVAVHRPIDLVFPSLGK
jgi:hypothetical protein